MKAFFPDRICGVIAAPSAREAVAQLRRALRQTRTVEVRLDWIPDPAEQLKLLGAARKLARGAAVVVTCRRAAAGGRLRGGIARQLLPLAVADALGFPWIDLEVETAARLGAAALRGLLERSRLLLSCHDFARTPRNLGAVVRRAARHGADAVKVATHCHSLRDALRLLALCRRRKNVIAVPMGEMGLPARVLALRHGSALAYAAVGESTAPGQLALETMRKLYRADRLGRRTRVYGVIGDPVAHSLSPAMHNAGYLARRLDAVYLPFRVRDLRDFLGAVGPLGLAGFSVTRPWKERILPHLDECDPLAARIGAVNTVVVRRGGSLYGCNTDYVGVLQALERRVRLAGSRVLILGAGGAARAAAFALAQAGAIVCVCARRPQEARRLAGAVGGEAVARRRLRREFFDAIVNCTPVGAPPRLRESPLAAQELNCRLVFDTVYRPRATKLLRLARRRGIEGVEGLEMLLAQGAAQWEIWTGQRAPVDVMRRAVLRALRRDPARLRGD